MIHLMAMIFFALLVSATFGVFTRDAMKARFFYSLKIFAEFAGTGVVLAWLLYFLP